MYNARKANSEGPDVAFVGFVHEIQNLSSVFVVIVICISVVFRPFLEDHMSTGTWGEARHPDARFLRSKYKLTSVSFREHLVSQTTEFS